MGKYYNSRLCVQHLKHISVIAMRPAIALSTTMFGHARFYIISDCLGGNTIGIDVVLNRNPTAAELSPVSGLLV